VRRLSGHRQFVTGIILTVLAGSMFAVMDAFAKNLTAVLPVIMVIWGRYFFHTVISTPI
jgi:hypothetical protein